jgi:hypothetical protein
MPVTFLDVGITMNAGKRHKADVTLQVEGGFLGQKELVIVDASITPVSSPISENPPPFVGD